MATVGAHTRIGVGCSNSLAVTSISPALRRGSAARWERDLVGFDQTAGTDCKTSRSLACACANPTKLAVRHPNWSHRTTNALFNMNPLHYSRTVSTWQHVTTFTNRHR